MQVQQVAKVTILNDTYNANPDSTLAALATLHTMVSKGKKIAVLADMLELGNQAEELHRQIGKILAQYSVDTLFTFGVLSKYTNDVALVKTKAHFENKSALIEHLLHTLSNNDIVLVKGSRGMKMEEVVISLIDRLTQKAGT
jgi:UDP-N-acetylmuramoyl-tripeptide--D-alanyl-D-alanine ligase